MFNDKTCKRSTLVTKLRHGNFKNVTCNRNGTILKLTNYFFVRKIIFFRSNKRLNSLLADALAPKFEKIEMSSFTSLYKNELPPINWS